MITVLVTHRPQLARRTDRIFVIEGKTISAQGSHKYLAEHNQFYRKAFEETLVDN